MLRRSAGIFCLTLFLTVSPFWLAPAGSIGPRSQAQTAHLRRPVAAAFLPDGRTLCLANQRSGTISLVDLAASRVLDEFPAGQRLTGLAVLPDGKHLLVTDEDRHELIALALPKCTVRTRLPVGPYPASVVVMPDGKRAVVASLWSRRVEVIDLTPLSAAEQTISLRCLQTIRLPFAARNACLLPGRYEVVIADAFAGSLAVLDVSRTKVIAIHRLNGHNLRGLTISADGLCLLAAHQVIDQKAPTTRSNVERGILMQNVLTSIPLAQLRTPGADIKSGRPLAREDAAGDPTGIVWLDADWLAAALGGVSEVALLRADGKQSQRLSVGLRPTLLLTSPGQPLVAVNTLDDSLSLIDPRQGTVTRTLKLGPQPKLTDKDRGEQVFYNARLSLGGSLSCHSCHTDGHTNGLLADTLGDGSFGTPKRTLTLRNTRMTDPWGWNGSMQYLHEQVQKSFAETMHARVQHDQVADLVSFLHSLSAPPPPEPATTDPADQRMIERGRLLFEQQKCVRCHIPPLTYSSHGVHDVGFADERGARQFNPPSLRGVGQGYRFLHDNRSASLEEVFTRFHHKVDDDLSPQQLADLLRFLSSL